jgi:hypothetical protein
MKENIENPGQLDHFVEGSYLKSILITTKLNLRKPVFRATSCVGSNNLVFTCSLRRPLAWNEGYLPCAPEI